MLGDELGRRAQALLCCRHRQRSRLHGFAELGGHDDADRPIYLSVTLDARSRRVVGYALVPHVDLRNSHRRRWPARDRVALVAGRMRLPHRRWQPDPTAGYFSPTQFEARHAQNVR
jgi:hypothetical protein